MTVLRALVAALTLALLAAPAARAEDAKARAQTHYKEGQTAYEGNDFAGALKSFELAFEAVPAPALYFNMAQCHRKLGHHAEAVNALEQFLSLQKKIPEKIRGDAETQLAEEKALLAAEQQAAPPLAAEPAPVVAPAAAEPAPVPDDEEEAPLWTNPIVIGAAAGTAVLVAAAGTTFAVLSLWPAPAPPDTTLGTVDLR